MGDHPRHLAAGLGDSGGHPRWTPEAAPSGWRHERRSDHDHRRPPTATTAATAATTQPSARAITPPLPLAPGRGRGGGRDCRALRGCPLGGPYRVHRPLYSREASEPSSTWPAGCSFPRTAPTSPSSGFRRRPIPRSSSVWRSSGSALRSSSVGWGSSAANWWSVPRWWCAGSSSTGAARRRRAACPEDN